jgi:hypothetical protein
VASRACGDKPHGLENQSPWDRRFKSQKRLAPFLFASMAVNPAVSILFLLLFGAPNNGSQESSAFLPC